MPALHDDDGDREAAKDHGNLMDLEVVEIEESVEVAEGQDDQRAGETAMATQPKRASDQQVVELIAEEHAEAQESLT